MAHPRLRQPRRLALALFAFLAACAATPSLSLDARRAIFEDAWQTIGEKHFDPKMGGVDWNAVKVRYAPRVDAARNDGELLAVLQAMVGELHHSHVAVLPPDYEATERRAAAAGAKNAAGTAGEPSTEPGTTGLRTAWLDDQIVVTDVLADSGAAAAGVRPGDALTAIDGRPLTGTLAAARRRGGDHWIGYVPYLVTGLLHGPIGSTVDLQLSSSGAPPRTTTVTRQRPEMAPMELGNLGSMDAEFESRLLAGNVLYVRFTPCFVPLQERFEQALAAHPDAAGVLLDLRDNPGGLGALAMGTARHFLREEKVLGSMRMRGADEPLRFQVNPSETPFTGPLVVLVNSSTGSTAEIFGAGMQCIGRARIVGQTSMGAALPSVIEQIAYGWRVQAVVADFTLPDGTSVEGRGVVPDVHVEATRADYAAGRDPFVEVGLREIGNAPRLAEATANASPSAPSTVTTTPTANAPCEMAAPMRELFERLCQDPSAQRLAAAKSIRITSRLELMGMSGPNITTIVAPDQLHSFGTLPGTGELLQVYDGKHAWSRNSFEGLRELTGEELAVVRRSARLDTRAWAEQFAKLELVGQKRDGDRDSFVVRQTPRDGEGKPILIHIDAVNLQTYRIETTVHSRMGAMAVATELSEFTDFGGIVLAKRSVSKIGGAKLTTITDRIEIDVPVDPALFGKPAPIEPKPAKATQGK